MRITESRLRSITRSVISESLDGTSWEGGVESGEKITLCDVLDYFEVNNIVPKEFYTLDLFYKLSDGKEVLYIIEKGGEDSNRRVKAASLEYPVIVVMRDRNIEYVLDGNHRLQKAKDLGIEFIKVSVLDLDDPRVPEEFVSIL